VEAFAIPVRVYWEDTDAGGVVYHASYLRFMERARTDWLRAMGIDQASLIRDERLQFVVVEANIRYHRPARFGDQLQVSLQVTERRGASMMMAQEIRRGTSSGELLVSATFRAACLDSDSLKPRPLPASMLAQP
jgi:acyl-CoA thioester hydrolase